MMNSKKTIVLIQAAYREINLALWAALIAFLIYFAVAVAPKISERQAAAERLQLLNINDENEANCAKWHMGPGTTLHNDCIFDLQDLRTKIERRLAEESFW